jgi:arginase
VATRAFLVPYDSGVRAERMGAGPLKLASLLPHLPQEVIEAQTPFRAEIKTSFELYRELAARIRASGDVPLVLGGNCGVSIGAVGGVGAEDLAVLWFDAHGDFMTPDTTPSGFLDGMCLAVIAGAAWRNLANAVPNFSPIPADRIIEAGSRDFSEGEEDALLSAGVSLVRPGESIVPALEQVRTRARRVLIHVDLDVIDASYGKANHFAVPGGLSPQQVCDAIRECRSRFEVAAVSIASFDPSQDERGTIAQAALQIIGALDWLN